MCYAVVECWNPHSQLKVKDDAGYAGGGFRTVYLLLEGGWEAIMNTRVLEIVGFDLGHGETAVAKAMMQSDADPEVLTIYGQKNQITALGIHPEGGVLIAEMAVKRPGVTQLEISFKRRPTDDAAFRQTVRMFLEAYYRYLIDNHLVEGGEASFFFVGYPAGWSAKEREEYETLLKEAGIPQLSVVPESRAAFMHAKETGQLTMNELLSPQCHPHAFA